MSDLPLELQDVIPFTIKDSDGLTELRALRRAVELSLGFKLLFVAPKDPRLSNELCETILKELGEIEPYVVRFDRPLHDLLGELERRIGSKAPQAVIVLGLELSMPDVDRVRTGEFVANLNTSRDRFPGVVMSPLLLVIDQDRLRELARGAPDFFSVRSGVFYFSELPPNLGGVLDLLLVPGSTNRADAAERLAGLPELDLSNRAITFLPPEIGTLSHLRRLDLTNNRLEQLPMEICRLLNLEELLLSANRLTVLPPELGRLQKLKRLELDDNPLRQPPEEVIAHGTQAVLTYLTEIVPAIRRQWRSKLIFVGEGGVGKSSLHRSLIGEAFDPELPTTHGIDIRSLHLQHPNDPDVVMTLSGWDFGGQEIYHATHQFFLTNRSLFLLVWNLRSGYEQGRLGYWLDTIKALAPDSPILLIATHADERVSSIPYDDLKRRYSQIVGSWQISNADRTGIDELRQAIADAASRLPLMGEEWPSTWLRVAEAIQTVNDTYISNQHLRELMREEGVEGDAQNVLARWLHELGEILYFHDDQELKGLIIFNPQWVAGAIGNVLESESVKDRLGVFRRNDMISVWREIDSGVQQQLLRLMERFDLAYRIPDDVGDTYLIVECLPYDQPDYLSVWDSALDQDGCKEIAMNFQFRQQSIPPGIPTWFIARSHRFSIGIHWRNGAVFADGPERRHLALIETHPSSRSLRLAVRGPSPHNFLALLIDGLELTLARYPGLEVERTVPCPGHQNRPCPHQFDYEYLQRAFSKDRLQVECPESFEDVSISQLLLGIDLSMQSNVLGRLEELDKRVSERQSGIESEFGELRELVQRQFLVSTNSQQRLSESQCPRVFALRPLNKSGWLRKSQSWELQLYCEAPGQWHPTTHGGRYKINKASEWADALAPSIRGLATVFKYAIPVVGPWLDVSQSEYEKSLRRDIEFMAELARKLPVTGDTSGPSTKDASENPQMAQGAAIRSLRQLLIDLDPVQHWGGLKRVLTPEGHWLWLCDHHAREYA